MSTEVRFTHESFGTRIVRAEVVPRIGDPVWFRDGGRGPEYAVKFVGFEISELHGMVTVIVELEVRHD